MGCSLGPQPRYHIWFCRLRGLEVLAGPIFRAFIPEPMDIGYVTNVSIYIYTHIQYMYRHLCMYVCIYMCIYIYTLVSVCIYTHIKLDRFINYTHMCTCIFHLLLICLMITSMASRRGFLSYFFPMNSMDFFDIHSDLVEFPGPLHQEVP